MPFVSVNLHIGNHLFSEDVVSAFFSLTEGNLNIMCRIYDDGKTEIPVTGISLIGKLDSERFLMLRLTYSGKCRGPL